MVIETRAGDVMVMTAGVRPVTSDGATYYDVRITVSLGQRSVCGEASIGDDGRAIGDSRDAWVSGGVLSLLDSEVAPDEVRAVLDGIETAAAARVAKEIGS